MRVGIIGVGEMGKNHVRVYHELGAKIVGVADVDRERATEIASQYGTKAFTGYTDLLSQKLDAVSIAVPTHLHREVALATIAQRVNLLVEKPLADTVAHGREIVATAEKAGLRLMVGHIERFNPAIQKLKQILDDGVLGGLVLLSTRRVGPFVPRMPDGIIIDVATHDIDIVQYLIGSECTSVYARSTRHRNAKGDAALIVLGFGDVSASVEVNWYTPHKVRSLTVTGTKGIACLDYIKQEVRIYTPTWKVAPKIVGMREPLKLELKHFLDCVKNNRQPMVTGYDGLKVLEIAIRAEQSTVTGATER